mmetsp:Transcript_25914/g.67994  ORF Transcript_25914/g.67994 Transcript_25914/m.67994 type:complete len:297 (-) Transcript_25914:1185-2075(-)
MVGGLDGFRARRCHPALCLADAATKVSDRSGSSAVRRTVNASTVRVCVHRADEVFPILANVSGPLSSDKASWVGSAPSRIGRAIGTCWSQLKAGTPGVRIIISFDRVFVCSVCGENTHKCGDPTIRRNLFDSQLCREDITWIGVVGGCFALEVPGVSIPSPHCGHIFRRHCAPTRRGEDPAVCSPTSTVECAVVDNLNLPKKRRTGKASVGDANPPIVAGNRVEVKYAVVQDSTDEVVLGATFCSTVLGWVTVPPVVHSRDHFDSVSRHVGHSQSQATAASGRLKIAADKFIMKVD